MADRPETRVTLGIDSANMGPVFKRLLALLLLLSALGKSGLGADDPLGPWNVSLRDPLDARFQDVVFGGNRFVAVGSAGLIMFSIDALNWQRVPSGVTNDLYSVSFVNGNFVAVG